MLSRSSVVLVAALVLGAVAVVAVAPTASACIQVYPYSELCRGSPVQGAKRIVCWETSGVACLP